MIDTSFWWHYGQVISSWINKKEASWKLKTLDQYILNQIVIVILVISLSSLEILSTLEISQSQGDYFSNRMLKTALGSGSESRWSLK